MRKEYPLGGDLFLATAFVLFVSAIFFRLLGIRHLFLGITIHGFLKVTVLCLLFSIAINLVDISRKIK